MLEARHRDVFRGGRDAPFGGEHVEGEHRRRVGRRDDGREGLQPRGRRGRGGPEAGLEPPGGPAPVARDAAAGAASFTRVALEATVASFRMAGASSHPTPRAARTAARSAPRVTALAAAGTAAPSRVGLAEAPRRLEHVVEREQRLDEVVAPRRVARGHEQAPRVVAGDQRDRPVTALGGGLERVATTTVTLRVIQQASSHRPAGVRRDAGAAGELDGDARGSSYPLEILSNGAGAALRKPFPS